MHVTTKDSSKDGANHILTSVLESDAATELVRADQVLKAEVLAVRRTVSGGIEVQTLVTIGNTEPEPEPEPPSTEAEDEESDD